MVYKTQIRLNPFRNFVIMTSGVNNEGNLPSPSKKAQQNLSAAARSLPSLPSIVVLIVTGLSLLVIISACKNDEKMIDDWSKKKIMVEEAKNIESYLSQEGKVKAKLTAPLMFRYEADTSIQNFQKHCM